ncbi:gamma-glutamylcyclotransferase family protein, partial [Salmonella enterica subsp. enterica serovar Infantis]
AWMYVYQRPDDAITLIESGDW